MKRLKKHERFGTRELAYIGTQEHDGERIPKSTKATHWAYAHDGQCRLVGPPTELFFTRDEWTCGSSGCMFFREREGQRPPEVDGFVYHMTFDDTRDACADKQWTHGLWPSLADKLEPWERLTGDDSNIGVLGDWRRWDADVVVHTYVKLEPVKKVTFVDSIADNVFFLDDAPSLEKREVSAIGGRLTVDGATLAWTECDVNFRGYEFSDGSRSFIDTSIFQHRKRISGVVEGPKYALFV